MSHTGRSQGARLRYASCFRPIHRRKLGLGSHLQQHNMHGMAWEPSWPQSLGVAGFESHSGLI